MIEEDKEKIIRFIDYQRKEFNLDNDTVRELYKLLTIYFEKYHSIDYLDNFLRNDLLLDSIKNYLIGFEVFLDYLKFIINVDGSCNYSTNEVTSLLYNVYTVLSYTDKKPLYSYTDFDIFNLICKLINTRQLVITRQFDFCLLEPYFFECNIYLKMFMLALYCNLSLVTGQTFDINNYDYKDISDKLYAACESFLSKENMANIKTHIALNCDHDNITQRDMYIAGFYYAESYIKNKYGHKEVTR